MHLSGMDKAHVKAILGVAGATEGKDGWVEIPDGPGLGIELDPAAIERYRVC